MPGLPVLFEKRLGHGTASDLVAYCDPHDLVAIATDGHDVVIYRISGQVAFTVKRKDSDLEVTALSWKQDGSLLGIGWSDGTYGLYSGENGRLTSQNSVRVNAGDRLWKLDLTPDFGADDDDEEGGAVVTSLRWTKHQTATTRLTESETIEAALGELSTDDWADGADEESMNDQQSRNGMPITGPASIGKLARHIATLDATTVLPRLSAIPSHGLRSGPDGTRFATQAATDLAFETAKDASTEDVDTLLVCASDGSVTILMDDSVKIGTLNVSPRPVMQTARGSSASHVVLSQKSEHEMHPSLIDVPLQLLGGPLLHVIATNTKRIQNLLAYTTQTIRCIQHDYTTGLQFPNRLMANMSMELEEKQQGDLVTELYHLAMTGHFSEVMLEWLTDIVKETNHKRWHQAIDTMYSNIQSHLFINLKPALDRLSIAAAELRSQAIFHEGSTTFEVEPDLFTKMLDGIDSLRTVAQKMMLLVITEHKQFKAFSKWLRVMIEIGVAGPGSKGAFETEERENPNIDYPLALAYIEHTMQKSNLVRHVEARPGFRGNCVKEYFFRKPELAQMSHARTLEAVQKLDQVEADGSLIVKGVQDADALLNLPALAVYLSGSTRMVLERITEWQSKMLSPPSSLPIETSAQRLLDMRLSFGQASATATKQKWMATVLSVPAEMPRRLYLDRIDPSTMREKRWGDAAGHEHEVWPNHTANFEVLDAKFHMDTILLLVRDDAGTYSIVPKQSAERRKKDRLHVFPADEGFRPEKLVIGGRGGKMVCVVLGNDGREWKVLDLDARRLGVKGAAGTTDEWMSEDDGDAEMTM